MKPPAWTCDGCRAEFETKEIDRYRRVRVNIAAVGGSARLDAEYELCPDCQARLVRLANPHDWEKARG